jgi:glycosyltransferase involved in cell wall biosynthesis
VGVSPPFPVVLFTNSPYMGGMEEHVVLLGRGLVRRGYRVAAICPSHDAVQPLRQRLQEAGVIVHCPVERRDAGLRAAGRLGHLIATVRRYPGCVVHLHLTGHQGGSLMALAGHLGRARAVVRTEHLPPVPPIGAGERMAVRLRDRFLERVICVSHETRRLHLTHLGRDPRKCVVVPNCVDLARFSPRAPSPSLYRELGLDPGQPVVGTVSRLHEARKGIAHFLDMAAAVAQVRPDARFIIVGDGPLRPALQDQATALGLSEKVIFTGERQDIPALLAAMHVFVMPSLYEGGPYTVLEAMAMGKPVVATPVGLVPDAVEHGITGFLAPPGDGAALAQAVLPLLADDDLARRLGRAARSKVAAGFSLDAMLNGVIDVYRTVA